MRFLSVNSCTAALHLSFLACKKFFGAKRVITTPVTFPATVNAILHAGLEPVFVDVRADDLNMDTRLAADLADNFDVMAPVHLFGNPCHMEPLLPFLTVGDLAHAIESELQGKKLCNFSQFSCYSFYATKNMTTAEGGMLGVRDDIGDDIFDYLSVMSMHGISKDAWKRYNDSRYHHWEAIEHGYKYNLTDIASAIGLVQLSKLDLFHAKREMLCSLYDELLSPIEQVRTPAIGKNIKHARHLYPILIDSSCGKTRDEVMHYLDEHGIGVGVHFRSLHKHKAFKDISCLTPIRNANLTDNIISLPLHPGLEPNHVEMVVQALQKCLR